MLSKKCIPARMPAGNLKESKIAGGGGGGYQWVYVCRVPALSL